MFTKIILADSHLIVRKGIRALIEDQPGMEVIAEADNGNILLKHVRKHEPDVVITEILLPELNGIDATKRITYEFPGVNVIALSSHLERFFVHEMLDAGAKGYCSKKCGLDELVHAIRAVTANKTYLSPEIKNIISEDYVYSLPKHRQRYFSGLTSRQLEVLQFHVEGYMIKEIASLLNISENTVKKHLQNAMNKLGLHTFIDLIKYAVIKGLISFDK